MTPHLDNSNLVRQSLNVAIISCVNTSKWQQSGTIFGEELGKRGEDMGMGLEKEEGNEEEREENGEGWERWRGYRDGIRKRRGK